MADESVKPKQPSTISEINRLPANQKRAIYTRMVPSAILERFHLNPFLVDIDGNDLVKIKGEPGSVSSEMSLYHKYGFRDPILYGHITDTLNGQIHVLLYVLNDPDSERYDVDILEDGTPTLFGTLRRNVDEEVAAMQAGLAPGQIRKGLRLMGTAIETFEKFVEDLGHELFFAEPLYYHNAVLFERHGFAYGKGRRLMERIQKGFESSGDLAAKLDNSTPFRFKHATDSIRLRSWALHDGLLGVPFSDVTMYKRCGKFAGISTCPDIPW